MILQIIPPSPETTMQAKLEKHNRAEYIFYNILDVSFTYIMFSILIYIFYSLLKMTLTRVETIFMF